jgi:hypothetical protein
LIFAGSADGQQAAGNAAAVAAARARQKAVKTADIKFQRTEVISRGGVSEIHQRGVVPGKKKMPVMPEKETTIKSVNRLVIDGIMIRYENHHSMWHVGRNAVMSNHAITVFNGGLGKGFFPDGIGMDGKPFGIITEKKQHMDIKSYVLMPITTAFRWLDRKIASPSIADFKPSGVTVPIRGAPCQEFVMRPSQDRIYSYWVDPKKDYVVRRIRNLLKGRLVNQVDIDHRRDDVCGWVPASWVYNQYSLSGALLISTKVDVLSMRLNKPQAAELFDVRFPPGTQVNDHRTSKEYRVQPNGTMREVSPTGKELGSTVYQPGDSWFQHHRWLLVSIGVVLAALVVGYFIRRKRVKHGSSG